MVPGAQFTTVRLWGSLGWGALAWQGRERTEFPVRVRHPLLSGRVRLTGFGLHLGPVTRA